MSAERLPPERWVADESPGKLLGPSGSRTRLGALLIALGVLGILWGVFHMLGAVGGPEQRDFAHRQTYNEVKPLVHAALFGSLLRSFGGLALCLLGGWVRHTAREAARSS